MCLQNPTPMASACWRRANRSSVGRCRRRRPRPGQVVVEVAGCGVCHTDVVVRRRRRARHATRCRWCWATRSPAGSSPRATAAAEWIGRAVIVPAVMPCGDCDACAAGRPTICRRQMMPGNDGHGGFATHVTVPASGLCAGAGGPSRGTVAAAAVGGRRRGDHAARGDPARRSRRATTWRSSSAPAASAALACRSPPRWAPRWWRSTSIARAWSWPPPTARRWPRRRRARRRARSRRPCGSSRARWSAPGIGLKIFESCGTAAGQRTAWSLLGPGAHLAVVGFTLDKLELRLSNLMAFDATAQGNWGCSPERYPEALDLVLGGKVALGPFVEMHPLDRAPEVLQAVAEHRLAGTGDPGARWAQDRAEAGTRAREEPRPGRPVRAARDPLRAAAGARPPGRAGRRPAQRLDHRSTTRAQLNSYTTEMVKEVILAFRRGVQRPRGGGAWSSPAPATGRSAPAATPRSTPSTTPARRGEYRQYMRLFNDMVSAILHCDKPVICRVNGMRIGGGQEIGMACDFSLASDLARLRPGRPQARLGARRRLHRLPAAVRRHRERDDRRHAVRAVDARTRPTSWAG